MSQTMTSSAGAQPSDHAVKSQSRRGSDVARKLKTLVDIANDFSTDSDIVVAVELVDQTFDLQNSLKQKNDRVEALENQIGELTARFENSSQDNLAIYEVAKKKLQVELESREKETLALKDDVHRKAHDIDVLKDHESKLLFEAERLQSSSRAQTERATANLTKIRDLEGSLNTIRDECIALQTQLRQEKDLYVQAKSSNASLEQRFDKLEKNYNSLLHEWQLAQSLTVKLSNGDSEQLSLNLDRMWSHTVQLVNSTFSQDVPEEVIKNEAAWKSLRDFDYGQPALPIVPSNSQSSKHMRMALILAVIARIFDVNLFQPTYFLDADFALRRLLIKQAQDENRKEAAIRGILQALLPKEQDSAASERVQQACGKVIHIVQGLLPSDLSPGFKDRLEEIAEEARDRWQAILRSNKAIAPSFEMEDDEDWVWDELCLNSDQSIVAVKARDRNNDDDYDGQSFVIFPRLYLWDESQEDPLSPGVILPIPQMTAAKEEEFAFLQKARSLTRERTKTRRAPNGNQIRRPSEPKDFLDRHSNS